MTNQARAEQLRRLERDVMKGEQELLGEIDACKRRHREQQAGSPRSYKLEEARREMRKLASALDAAEQRNAVSEWLNGCYAGSVTTLFVLAIVVASAPQLNWQAFAVFASVVVIAWAVGRRSPDPS